jgi:hypothetical protein
VFDFTYLRDMKPSAAFAACCCLAAQLANGEWKLLQGLGKGAELEAKCDYRVEECLTMARVLQAMSTGKPLHPPGKDLLYHMLWCLVGWHNIPCTQFFACCLIRHQLRSACAR